MSWSGSVVFGVAVVGGNLRALWVVLCSGGARKGEGWTPFRRARGSLIVWGKEISRRTKISCVFLVSGDRAYWLPNGRFLRLQPGKRQTCPAGGSLLWERGNVALLMRADVAKEGAIRIAESIR